MSDKRLTPEEALNICNQQCRGMLKIFLGYAPGVGKTFAMLGEANRRLKYGKDIVIGYVENHGREETEKQICDLQILPRKKITYNGVELEELDVQSVLIVILKQFWLMSLHIQMCPALKIKKDMKMCLKYCRVGLV